MAEGVRLEITIKDLGIGPALDRAVEGGTDLTEILKSSGTLLQTSVRGRFDSGRGPSGIPWPPVKRVAKGAEKKLKKAGKAIRPHKPLVDTGAMLGDLGQQIEGKTLLVGIQDLHRSSHYAYVHQFGAVITPKKGRFLVFTGSDGGLVFAEKVVIPARPFLGFDSQDMADLEDLWSDYARGLLS